MYATIEAKQKQLTGDYNIYDLFKEFQANNENDMLEYVDDNVEIRKSTLNKGQGIFAKETI